MSDNGVTTLKVWQLQGEQLAHTPENGGEIDRLLVLCVGALADMGVDPVAGALLLGE